MPNDSLCLFPDGSVKVLHNRRDHVIPDPASPDVARRFPKTLGMYPSIWQPTERVCGIATNSNLKALVRFFFWKIIIQKWFKGFNQEIINSLHVDWNWLTQCDSAAMNRLWQESRQRTVFSATWKGRTMLDSMLFWGRGLGNSSRFFTGLGGRWRDAAAARCPGRPRCLSEIQNPQDGVTVDTLAPSRVSPSLQPAALTIHITGERERDGEKGDDSFLRIWVK